MPELLCRLLPPAFLEVSVLECSQAYARRNPIEAQTLNSIEHEKHSEPMNNPPCVKVTPTPNKLYELIGFGAVDVTKRAEFIGFGAMDVTKPHEFIWFLNWGVMVRAGGLIRKCDRNSGILGRPTVEGIN